MRGNLAKNRQLRRNYCSSQKVFTDLRKIKKNNKKKKRQTKSLPFLYGSQPFLYLRQTDHHIVFS